MKVTTETKIDILQISIEGSVDSKTSGDLQQQIFEASANATKVILDFTRVTFVSSAGLRVLLTVYRQIKSRDGRVILVGVSEEIKDVMSMTGFINFFELSNSIEDALTLL